MRDKIKIVVVGNCQARPLATMLSKASPDVDILGVGIVHLLKESDEDQYRSMLDSADYIVAQLVADNYPVSFVRTSSLTERYPRKVIKILNLFYMGNTPEWRYLRTANRVPLKGPMGDYHNEIIFYGWRNGFTASETLQALSAAQNSVQLQKIAEQSMSELVHREEEVDVLISDFLKERMHVERLFHIFNHPTNRLLEEYARRIAVRMELAVSSKGLNLKKEALGQFVPSYDSVSVGPGRHSPLHLGVKFMIKNGAIETGSQSLYDSNEIIQKFYEVYSASKNLISEIGCESGYAEFFLNSKNQKENRKNKVLGKKNKSGLLNSFKSKLFKASSGEPIVSPFPRTIVQYWDQGEPPRDIVGLMESWRGMSEEFTYLLFDRKSAYNFISVNYGSEIAGLFDCAAIPAMRSDIFRVAYILKEGGVYVDAATECVSDIARLFESGFKLILMRKWHGGIWNGFLAAESGNNVIADVWDRQLQNLREKKINDVWKATGPGIFNELLSRDVYDNLQVIDQQVMKEFFHLKNDLEHKRDSHWSKIQSGIDIYKDPEQQREVEEDSNSDRKLKSVILHLGPHKTGSTSFQNFLESNESSFEDVSISLITVRSTRSSGYKEWRIEYTKVVQSYILDLLDYSQAKSRLVEIIRDLWVKCKCNGERVILSDENLLGPVPGHYFAGGRGRDGSFYKAKDLVLESWTEALCGVDLSFLFVKRDLSAFVCSSYRDFVSKLDSSESLLQFYLALDDDFAADFSRFFSSLSNRSRSDFLIFDFNEFTSSFSELTLNLLGVRVANMLSESSNRSMSWRAIEMAMRVSDLLSPEEKPLFRRFLTNKIDGESLLFNKERAELDRHIDRALLNNP